MTFRRSLYISISLHVLLFGCAIAFAQFAKGALWGHRDVTVVSLIDAGSGTEGRVSQGSERRKVVTDSVSETIHERSASEAQPEVPSESQHAREEASLPGVQENNNVGTGNDSIGGVSNGQAGDNSTGSGSDTQLGVVPPEQWAVIVSSIERVKSYPRFARERGIQGVVHLRFRVKPEGDIDSVEIVRSSGYEILDTASVRTVYRAAPMPYVNGWIEVPIAYVLK